MSDMRYKKRYEVKFMIDFDTYKRLLKTLGPFITPDRNWKQQDGKYCIRSVYFDSPAKDFYKEKIEGENFRNKIRIRTYYSLNNEKSKTFLEIKKRYDKTLKKIKVRISEEDAKKFINRPDFSGDYIKNLDEKSIVILQEVATLATRFKIRPIVVVSYTRQAFIGRYSPNVRITFDSNLKYKTREYELDKKNLIRYIIPPNFIIFEIKYSGMLPVWIPQIIGKYNLQHMSFSKYCKSVEKFVEDGI